MGFGVLEPKVTIGEHVPGTALIYDDGRGTEEEIAVQAALKRDGGKNSDVILVPQPSDSPNDPLVRASLSTGKRNKNNRLQTLTSTTRIGQNGRKTWPTSPSATQQ